MNSPEIKNKQSMETLEKTNVRVETTINAPIEKVWALWTDPRHVMHWNNASDDWCTSYAENDLSIGGKFVYRMEARDNTAGFDFSGEYTRIEPLKVIEYKLDDERKVEVHFHQTGSRTTVTEVFGTETTNPVNVQKKGWQAILDNFRDYVEKKGNHEILHFETRIKSSIEKVYKTMTDKEGYRRWTLNSIRLPILRAHGKKAQKCSSSVQISKESREAW
jgi:uncharacterized protein YndB with AHSA1/START domain